MSNHQCEHGVIVDVLNSARCRQCDARAGMMLRAAFGEQPAATEAAPVHPHRPHVMTDARDPLDDLCAAISRFGDAQFELGAGPTRTALASLAQAQTAHDALWRIITRILEAAASAVADSPANSYALELASLRQQLSDMQRLYDRQGENFLVLMEYAAGLRERPSFMPSHDGAVALAVAHCRADKAAHSPTGEQSHAS